MAQNDCMNVSYESYHNRIVDEEQMKVRYNKRRCLLPCFISQISSAMNKNFSNDVCKFVFRSGQA